MKISRKKKLNAFFTILCHIQTVNNPWLNMVSFDAFKHVRKWHKVDTYYWIVSQLLRPSEKCHSKIIRFLLLNRILIIVALSVYSTCWSKSCFEIFLGNSLECADPHADIRLKYAAFYFVVYASTLVMSVHKYDAYVCLYIVRYFWFPGIFISYVL